MNAGIAEGVGRLVVVILSAGVVVPGCAPDEESPCRLAWLPDRGGVTLEDPLTEPMSVLEVRRAMCVRGVVPCADGRVDLRSDEPDVVGVFTDIEVRWVFYVVGRAPGRTTVRLICDLEASEHAVEVR